MPIPTPVVDDDLIQPFQIDASHLRGRLVRLGSTLDEILGRHDYPLPVAQVLGELLTLAVTLSAALKYEGIFTLQIKGDGPVTMMVAAVTSVGDVRGYAQFDAEKLKKVMAALQPNQVPYLLGKGYLAFTVDQGDDTERYQGIVDLVGATMAECVQHYFRQSEQLDTGIQLAVAPQVGEQTRWRAGALMIQRLPTEDAPPLADPGSAAEDDWRRTMLLLASCTPDELLSPDLPAHDLLYRLFHEEGVRVYNPGTVRFSCRCTRERVENVLKSLPRSEVEDLKVNGHIAATCEFCNTTYDFGDEDLAELFEGS